MTKKYIVLAIFILAFAVGGSFVSAQTENNTVSTVLQAEKVTAADLGVTDPGVLPTSPLYFLKEWRRGIREFFTFNPISKTELELRYVNEKAAETQKVAEDSPNNGEAIAKAAENYKAAQQQLKARLESLKETSQNPNVDRLLENLAERSIKHTKLFEDLSQGFSGQVPTVLAEATDKIAETVAEGFKKDEPVKFAAKLEKVFTKEEGSELKHVRSLEVIDKLSNLAPETARTSLERLREDFTNRLNEDLKTVVQKVGEDKLKEAITALPGDEARKSIILEEVKAKAESRVAQVIKDANIILENTVKKSSDIAVRAKDEISVAEKVLNDARSKIADAQTSVSSVAKRLLENAEENLKDATIAFSAGGYGEAFGMARSAEVLARSAWQLVGEKEELVPENLNEEFTALEAKIEKYGELLESRGWTKEDQPKAYQLLENAKTHLGFARDESAKNNLQAVRMHFGHVIGFLTDLSRLLDSGSKLPVAPVAGQSGTVPFVAQCEGLKDRIAELEKKLETGEITKELYETKYASYKSVTLECEKYDKAPAQPVSQSVSAIKEPIYCTEQYVPVCGVDGKTYSNDCYANRSGVKIQYKGECGSSGSPNVCPLIALPSEEEMKKCSVSGGNYQKKTNENGCVIGYYCILPIKDSGTLIPPSVTAATVTYTDSGFSPATLTIKKGQTVTFVNKSSRYFWPASAIHPTHTVYPTTGGCLGSTFDACEKLEPGKSWSFEFDIPGKWNYHDHINAGYYGTIVVE